jgi:aminoglycoside phosphotransferase (APT) family kinase protein
VEPVEVLRTRFPALEIHHCRVIEDGWDSLVLEVNEEYVFRFPRRPEVEDWVEREILLLPELAETLPVAVPRFDFVARNGLSCVGYRKLVGEPASADLSERAGEDLGGFLAALHRFPVERARALGVPCYEPAAWREHFAGFCSDLRRRVLPLLTSAEQERAESLFAEVAGLDFEPVLLHSDLGPQHVLVRGGRVLGVIDWSDARVGDPALDFAWCLHGTSWATADAVARSYGLDSRTRDRSLFYRRLGPWYEVTYGLDTDQPRLVESGVAGIRSRLPG